MRMKKKKPLYVVHTMGKVASRAVADYLQSAGLATVHAHYLCLPSREEDRKAKEVIMKWKGEINVITIVRDPIARNLSAYFQNVVKPGETPSVEDFLERYNHRVALDWYWGEFFDFWGVGMQGFNQGRGIAVYPQMEWPRSMKKTMNVHIFRTDNLSQLPEVLAMSGVEGLQPIKSQGVNKDERYLQFVKEAKFSKEFVAEMYWSLYAQAFWEEAELEVFRKRWLDETIS